MGFRALMLEDLASDDRVGVDGTVAAGPGGRWATDDIEPAPEE